MYTYIYIVVETKRINCVDRAEDVSCDLEVSCDLDVRVAGVYITIMSRDVII